MTEDIVVILGHVQNLCPPVEGSEGLESLDVRVSQNYRSL